MKILIKGAGDLATGIASRLFNGGHQILMTELPVPLTVRRTVALSRAVYDGEAVIENMRGVLVSDLEQALQIIKDGDIPVMVDEKAEIREAFRPDVVVDAILAKKNLGTRITDAPLVIGVGPGFEAGTDCHCVVETKRGHTLGSVIIEGSAIPNTGVPGNIGGYTTERLLKAAADGRIRPMVSIGDLVEKGQITAYTGEMPVYAQMPGIVRGMLQPDVEVTKGMKIGDIDARSQKENCHTISDKARAIGGGVLEVVSGFEHGRFPAQSAGKQKLKEEKYAIVVLASGKSTRFGRDKLLEEVGGEKMYQHMLKLLKDAKN